MIKTQLYRIVFTLFALALFTACSQDLADQPNILFITTDYQAWEDIPHLTPALEMPTLEKLYNEGVRFENHYCTAPICMPARHTIISGTYPHTHGTYDNGPRWPRDEDLNMMDALREYGYKTINVGKIHYNPWDQMDGFDYRVFAETTGNGAWDTLKNDDYARYLAEVGLNRWDYLKYQDSTGIYGVYDWPLHDTLDIDYFVGSQAVQLIRHDTIPTDKPWFFWVSFNGPHNPWDARKELAEKYMAKDLPPARYQEGELETKPVDYTTLRYNYTRKLADQFDMNPDRREEYVKRIKAGHYGQLEVIDQQMKRVIDELKQKGQLKNTIIIFSTDHGALLGDHNAFHKGSDLERSAHVPFMVWNPWRFKPHTVQGYTEHVDVFPTFVELAGGSKKDALEGRSLLPELMGNANGDDKAFIEIFRDFTVVTDDYKFGLHTPYDEGVLYDRKLDPNEYNNLYFDKNYEQVVDSLTDVLYAFHPPIADMMKNRLPVLPPVEKVVLSGNDIRSGTSIPFFPGNELVVDLDFTLEGKSSGILLNHHIGNVHGFHLSVQDNKLTFYVREFYEDTAYPLLQPTPGNHRLHIAIDKDGIMEWNIDGEHSGKVQTTWPITRQPGRYEVMSGFLMTGRVIPGWMHPFSEVDSISFDGQIIKAEVRTSKL